MGETGAEETWRVYASREWALYTSSSSIDPLASEECRAWAVDKYAENPLMSANIITRRQDPKKPGQWQVILLIPTRWDDSSYESNRDALEFIGEHPEMRLPVAVKTGSEEEIRLTDLARRLIHGRR